MNQNESHTHTEPRIGKNAGTSYFVIRLLLSEEHAAFLSVREVKLAHPKERNLPKLTTGTQSVYLWASERMSDEVRDTLYKSLHKSACSSLIQQLYFVP